MPIFGKSSKSPADVVRSLKDTLLVLESEELSIATVGAPDAARRISATQVSGDKKQKKVQEDLSKQLQNIKSLLLGSEASAPVGAADIGEGSGSGSQSEIVAQFSQEVYQSGLLLLLLRNLHRINFEGKKDVVQGFNILLHRQEGTRTPTVEYICTNPLIVFTLCRGYEEQDIALHCGNMLRECVKYEALAKALLYAEQFYDFFEYVQVSTFDIAADAFATFKDLLTKHKAIAADFLETNYETVFENYRKLLHSDNFVTMCQSLKLLGELLLDRQNFSVMTRYISNPASLKLVMNILKEKGRNIQFEAFHVFKVFVANPNKPKPILDILIRNREKLIDFLSNFQNDRNEDKQFNDEKEYLIKHIKELNSSPTTVPSKRTSSR